MKWSISTIAAGIPWPLPTMPGQLLREPAPHAAAPDSAPWTHPDANNLFKGIFAIVSTTSIPNPAPMSPTEATVDPRRGPDWMPITPKTGSLFYADPHADKAGPLQYAPHAPPPLPFHYRGNG